MPLLLMWPLMLYLAVSVYINKYVIVVLPLLVSKLIIKVKKCQVSYLCSHQPQKNKMAGFTVERVFFYIVQPAL